MCGGLTLWCHELQKDRKGGNHRFASNMQSCHTIISTGMRSRRFKHAFFMLRFSRRAVFLIILASVGVVLASKKDDDTIPSWHPHSIRRRNERWTQGRLRNLTALS